MPIDNLSKITSRSGINTTILLEAGNANVTGIVTAAGFVGPFTGGGDIAAGIITGTGLKISGISTLNGAVYINRTSALGNSKLSITKDASQEGIGVQLNVSSGITTSLTTFNSSGTQIFDLAHDTDSTPDLIFKLKHPSVGFPVERVRIASNGNVGISSNNSTPEALLDIKNVGTSVLPFKAYRNDVGDTPIMHLLAYNNTLGVVDKLVVTSRGRVGVNTDDPQREIHIKPDSSTASAAPAYVRIESHGSNQSAELELYHTRGNGSDKWPSAVASADGALTLKVANGNNGAPAEKVRITSDGKVGINSTSPSNTLVVQESTDNNSSIQLFRASTGGDIASINWATNQGNQAKINYRGATPSGMQFYTGGGADSNLRMLIDPDGNVGIGTNEPNRLLTLFGNDQPVFQITNRTSGDANTRGSIFYQMSGTSTLAVDNQGAGSGGNIHFMAAGSNTFQITSGGLIKAMTRSAEERRMILSGSPSNSAFNIEAHDGESGTSSGNVQGKLGLFYNDGSTLTNTANISFERGSGAADGAMAFVTNQTERLRITSGGDVGIGTDNPQAQLEVYKVGTGVTATSVVRGENAVFAIMGDATNTGASEIDARLVFSSDGDVSPSKILTSPLAAHGFEIALINEEPGAGLRFHDGTVNTERLRIDTGGRVGINTNVHADTASALTIQNGAAASEHTILDIRCDDNETSRIYFSERSTSGNGSIRYRYTSDDRYMSFYTNGTGTSNERLRITKLGHISIISGNLEFANGSGIDFSNVPDGSRSIDSDGNKFDDYEEGSFTPYYYTQNSLLTAGYVSQDGKYTKIGRFVHFQIYLRLSSKSGGSGHLRVYGLPFTSSSATGAAYGGGVVAYTNNWDNDAIDRIMVGSGSDQVQLFVGTSSGTNVNAGAGNLNSDTQLRIFGSYQV